MFKNPWFTLILGLMTGLVVGYALAERQTVPPSRLPAAAAQQGMPDGHPPVQQPAQPVADGQVEAHAAELRQLLAASPEDRGLMIALGNVYFDASRWEEARLWYENALEGVTAPDPNVLTDLAVVYRNLQRPERSLELLQQATSIDPTHWQAVYNTVIVLHFDLHRHDEAERALAELERMAASNPSVPDLAGLKAEVLGG